MNKLARQSALTVAGLGALLIASPAGAQACQYPEANCVVVPEVVTEVGAVTLEPEVVPVAAPVAAKPVAVAAKQQLPVTGTDVIYLVGGGVALLASGIVLTRRAKVAGNAS